MIVCYVRDTADDRRTLYGVRTPPEAAGVYTREHSEIRKGNFDHGVKEAEGK